MRFLSFLPMLLLLVSSVGAQNQCSIYDLTATVVSTDPNTCQYYVVLDFQHEATTTQYTVTGNSVNYGTFSYDSIPLKLGPFVADPTPSVKEFVVTDITYPDCNDAVEVQVPACSQNNICDVYDLSVTAGDCNPGGLTFQVTLNFKVNNPGNDFFEVWAGNGIYLGIYPLASLPLTIPAFPWSGDPTDHLKVCINDNSGCCETATFDVPDCIQGPCDITNLTADRGDCTSDSTYNVIVNFNLLNTPAASKFGMWADGVFLGFYGTDQLPITIDSFPWNGGTTDTLKVCIVEIVNDPQNPIVICCESIVIDVPDCLPIFPCGIKDLSVETDSCSSDSTFGVWVNFAVNDPMSVDSFQLWGNGHDFGTFSIDSLPLHIADFPWNNGIFSYIKVCTGTAPTCCKEYQFLAPDCLPFGPCEVTDIFMHTGKCTSDSTYKANLNFQATNPGDGKFAVWANGVSLGVFPLDAAPLTIDSFPWNGGNTDTVTVCILDSTAMSPCCRDKAFNVPVCLLGDSCSITNVVVTPGDCNPGNDSYSLTVDFEVNDPGNDFFELWTGNGVYLGYFPLSDLPLTIPAFPCNNAGVGVLKICINDNSDCCATVDFQAPNCCGNNNPCEITDLTVETGNCNGNDSYEVWINFNVSNPLSDHFGVWANGDFIGTYSLDSLPLYIPDFPTNGGIHDVVKVCFFTSNGVYGCCKTLEFDVPDCIVQPCEIYDLTVETGDCTGDSTYQAWVNFSVNNPPGSTYGVWLNGAFYGTFNYDSLPLQIDSFPWNGGQNDVVKVCFFNGNDPNNGTSCCRTKEFAVPDCLNPGGPCEIYNLTVETGDCTGDSTYQVWINFSVDNPPGDIVGVWANGVFFGTYDAGSLPIQIDSFPWNGGSNDVVKVCFVNPNDPVNSATCCRTKEFPVPNCLGNACEIYNLSVETGDCTGDSTYQVWINFSVHNPPGDIVGVWANGVFFGTYDADSLPIQIDSFPWNGGSNDVVKVCFVDPNDPVNSATCCRTKEFAVPDCLTPGGACEIYNLTVETGDCTGDSTYQVWINFSVHNPPGDIVGVWANGVFFGTYDAGSLPIQIDSFPWNGGPEDVVKVCFIDPNDPVGSATCCRTKEFYVPDCLDQGSPCQIHDLTVETGDCTGDSTYQVWINFSVDNPPGNTYGLWINGVFYDSFSLDSLPLHIENFPWDGGLYDEVKVCFNNPNGYGCCKTAEFQVPDCLDQGGGPCHIYDLTIETGDCTGDSTYTVTINFQVDNPPADVFDLWANGSYFGTYNLNQLPLTIQDFPWDGGPVDHVRVCIFDDNAPPGQPFCCKQQPFQVPDCLGNNGPCEIYDLTVETGNCTSDDTYEVWINFSVDNPPGDQFGVWANGDFLGLFDLDSLPLYIADFPWNGGNHDEVKVCFPAPNGGTTCCKTKEFAVPDCLDQNPCHIYDMNVVATPCLCGQFFALITFNHSNGGNQGFDIVGNGNDYGNFPYNYPQPIILGPFDGDGMTDYEFEVHDHQHPDCADNFDFGTVDCMTPVINPGNDAMLSLSPNPTSNWLNVTAQLQSGVQIGEASVKVYHADGRLMRMITVANGSSFQLDVSDLPSGVYRLTLLSATGRVEGTFVKQQ